MWGDPVLDLLPDQLSIVKNILSQWVPGKKVVAFGSRVLGKAKPFSDLDLAIYSDATLPAATMAHMRDAFSASNLPIKVDLVEVFGLDEGFRKIIEGQAELIQAETTAPVKS